MICAIPRPDPDSRLRFYGERNVIDLNCGSDIDSAGRKYHNDIYVMIEHGVANNTDLAMNGVDISYRFGEAYDLTATCRALV